MELLAENTGGSFKKNRLTRLRRGRVSDSPPTTSSRRRAVVESSDEEIDNDGTLPQVQDIQKIWDDERGRDDDEEYGDMDLDDFIEYDEESGTMDEASRAERRREQQELQRRKRASGSRTELAGIDAKYVELDVSLSLASPVLSVPGTKFTTFLGMVMTMIGHWLGTTNMTKKKNGTNKTRNTKMYATSSYLCTC